MTAYYNEHEPFAAAWLRNLIAAGHIANGVVDERDIRDVLPTELVGYTQYHFFAGIGVWSRALRLAGWDDERPVWTGSCPCQPFSEAGAGLGFADERHLWPAWHHLIEQCRPPTVFGEQVAKKAGCAWFSLVRSDLEGAGYSVGAADMCAAGVGAPHIRQRLYFVADTIGTRLERGDEGEVGRQRAAAERSGGISGVANATARRQREHRGAPRQGGHAALSDETGGVADDVRDGPQRPEPADATGGGRRSSDTRASGFWRDAEWLPCRDDRRRPVEPGTFPLAHGATARVGRLRSYGNAIVAPAAAEFIAAYREARGEAVGGLADVTMMEMLA